MFKPQISFTNKINDIKNDYTEFTQMCLVSMLMLEHLQSNILSIIIGGK